VPQHVHNKPDEYSQTSSRVAAKLITRSRSGWFGIESRAAENIGRHPEEIERAQGRKVNKNLYEITGLVGEPLVSSLLRPHPFRSRYLPVLLSLFLFLSLSLRSWSAGYYIPPAARIPIIESSHDVSSAEEPEPRQIVTYFTFFPKSSADLPTAASPDK